MWNWNVVTFAAIFCTVAIEPDVREEVRREARQNTQLHDVVHALENVDKEEVKKIKSERNLAALIQTSPDIAEEVRKEAAQNIQIHDVFNVMERRDQQDAKNIRGDKNFAALLQKSAPEVPLAVRRETADNIQMADDVQEEKRIHGDKNLQALQIQNIDDYDNHNDAMNRYLGNLHFSMPVVNEPKPAPIHEDSPGDPKVTSIPLSSQLQENLMQRTTVNHRLRGKTAPGVEKKVAEEQMEDVYIQDKFRTLEAADARDVKLAKRDPSEIKVRSS
eukprot:GEMP01077859.1.p1 GENE.GEMP01077859.1~~GEMP01077859.1.p1  ORF type:complete len:275 (+),score=84.07 GEMP01077859.1:118-942(+)